jgi:hypothetical protein
MQIGGLNGTKPVRVLSAQQVRGRKALSFEYYPERLASKNQILIKVPKLAILETFLTCFRGEPSGEYRARTGHL